MGYAGTDSYSDVDLCDYMDLSEAQVAALDDAEVKSQLSKEAWEMAVEKVDAWAEPIDKDEMD